MFVRPAEHPISTLLIVLVVCAGVCAPPSALAQPTAADQIVNDGGSSATVAFSLIQGGLPEGSSDQGGNIDADPRLVDPDGADNVPGSVDDEVGIQGSSPAVNAGSNALLPPDRFDIDGDGDTSEPIPIDIAGGARSIDPGGGTSVVDMGAYESGTAPSVAVGPRSTVLPIEFSVPFPNPITYGSALTFRVPSTERVEVSIFDVSGRQRLVLFDGVAVGDRPYRIQIPSEQLASGVYFARLTSNSFEKASQFVVVR